MKRKRSSRGTCTISLLSATKIFRISVLMVLNIIAKYNLIFGFFFSIIIRISIVDKYWIRSMREFLFSLFDSWDELSYTMASVSSVKRN